MKSFTEFLAEKSSSRAELLRKVISGRRDLDATQYKERMSGNPEWEKKARASLHHTDVADVVKQLDPGDSRRWRSNRPRNAKKIRHYLGANPKVKDKKKTVDPFKSFLNTWKKNERAVTSMWRAWGLKEARERPDTHVIHFGRITVPTKGHYVNINFTKNLARNLGASLSIITSRTFGDKKNPLPPSTKLKHINRAFPDARVKMASKKMPTIFDHAAKANRAGARNLVVVAGSDRVNAYDKMLNSYNGKLYNFDSIKVVSSGERVAGVSGTDMRRHAASGDFKSFRQGLAPHLRDNVSHARQLYNDLRQRLKKG